MIKGLVNISRTIIDISIREKEIVNGEIVIQYIMEDFLELKEDKPMYIKKKTGPD